MDRPNDFSIIKQESDFLVPDVRPHHCQHRHVSHVRLCLTGGRFRAQSGATGN